MIWGYHVAASTQKIILFNFRRGQLLIVFAGSQKGRNTANLSSLLAYLKDCHCN